MPLYYFGTGAPSNSITAATSRYIGIGGAFIASSTDLPIAFTVRSNFVVKRFALEVNANASTAASTILSRKNGADGACTVSVPSSTGAGATGEFEDAVNTDSLASLTSDTYNWVVRVGAGGTLTISHISALASNAGNMTFYQNAVSSAGRNVNPAVARYFAVPVPGLVSYTSEDDAQYTWPQAARLSNLAFHLPLNATTTAGSEVNLHINGTTGSMKVAFTTGLTGTFEDTVNSDVIAAGDEVNYATSNVNTGAGTSYTISMISVHSSQSGRIVGTQTSGALTSAGTANFWPLAAGQGASGFSTEAEMTIPIRHNFRASNLFFNLDANAGGITAGLRRNGATTISATVSSGSTAFGSESVTSVALSTGDRLNFFWDIPAGSGVGGATVNFIGILLDQPAAAPGGNTGGFLLLKGVGQ